MTAAAAPTRFAISTLIIMASIARVLGQKIEIPYALPSGRSMQSSFVSAGPISEPVSNAITTRCNSTCGSGIGVNSMLICLLGSMHLMSGFGRGQPVSF
jgi:hypothetical protein